MGPESAGSTPGPACYGRGGDRPTSSDASIVLGHLNPDYFAGGTLRLQPELSRTVIGELASRLDLTPMDTALGMYRVLVSQMAEAIKLVTVKRGVDPRSFTLVSFGGGGGIYAAAVAREIGIEEVLVPRSPGTLSQAGHETGFRKCLQHGRPRVDVPRPETVAESTISYTEPEISWHDGTGFQPTGKRR